MSERFSDLVEFLAEHRGEPEQARALLTRAQIGAADVPVTGEGRDMWTRILHELESVRTEEELARFVEQVGEELPRAPIEVNEPEDSDPVPDPVAESPPESAPSEPEPSKPEPDKPEPAAEVEAKATPEPDEPKPSEPEPKPDEPKPATKTPATRDEADADKGRKLGPDLASAVGGAALILVSVLIWTQTEVPASADAALKILVALGAGFLGGGITGRIRVAIAPERGGLGGWKIEAFGGAAVSLLVGVVLFYPREPTAEPEPEPEPDAKIPARPEPKKPEPATPDLPTPPPGMRFVPDGSFEMGTADWERVHTACVNVYGDNCTEATSKRESETAGTRQVAAFFLDEHEVSVAELAQWFSARIEANAVAIEGDFLVHDGIVWARLSWPGPAGDILVFEREGDRLRAAAGSELLPASLVTWWAARAYCEDTGKRLPTESEWEYAARGPESLDFALAPGHPEGCDAFVHGRDFLDPTSAMSECKAMPKRPEPVGSSTHDLSWAGVRDLTGNVSEWVADAYVDPEDADPDTIVRPCVERTESSAYGERECRIYKGGSWTDPKMFARAARRYVMDATATGPEHVRQPGGKGRAILAPSVGFRCAMDTPSPGQE